ncbi:MAG: sigma 54-interacting transcriptional regulator [Desulfohalobiaceae bacterium]|nr:sigma 54-interacting transcriptional regulator [Desulfohalobiaceae bacterium]
MNQSLLEDLLADPQNLTHVLDNLQEGVIAHDLQRNIFFFNRRAEDITGYSREEVLGRDCHQVFEQPFCGEQCSFCTAEPPDFDISEYRINIVNKAGETRKIEMSAIMMRDDAGRAIGVLATLRDITDLLNLQFKVRELTGFHNIIGRDPQMIEIFKQIRDVAEYEFPVHIFGETGTGKELVAEAIHNESRSEAAPFVPINCGALPEGLIESELFGHVKGAFSGAIRDKKGRFELAENGTIFLDEVGELPRHLQVKLLRFLQSGTFTRVGGEKTLRIEARVISATNKDLKQEIKTGAFREDLFYRLNVIPISLPPLRKRKNDIPLLAEHFLSRFNSVKKKGPITISDPALSLMMDYSWPGNVRELENVLQFALVKAKGRTIEPGDLPFELKQDLSPSKKRGPDQKLDPERVKAVLSETDGNKVRAARLLGVGRATLYRYLDRMKDDK